MSVDLSYLFFMAYFCYKTLFFIGYSYNISNPFLQNSGDSLDQYQLNLPDPATPIAFGIHSLHNHILFFLCIILATVLFLLFSILFHFSFYKDKYYNPLFYYHVLVNSLLSFIINLMNLITRFFNNFSKVRSTVPVSFNIFNYAYIFVTSSVTAWLDNTFSILVSSWHLENYYSVFPEFRGQWQNNRFRFLVSVRQLPIRLLKKLSEIIGYLTFLKKEVCITFILTKQGVFNVVSCHSDRVFIYPKKKLQWLNYIVAHRQYRVTHNLDLEVIWTIIPTLILVTIAIPSFALLYSMDELLDPTVTIKVVGHQWYWSYEYSDLRPLIGTTINFDSYMVPDTDLVPGDLRLLKTDCPLILPKETNIRFLITSTDVLHSWAVPSFGIKMDAVPGRLNQTSTYIMESGRYYGQCSELCGVNHGFMPIEICVVEPVDYYNWLFLRSK